MKTLVQNQKGLTATFLKWVALFTMIADHVGYTLQGVLPTPVYMLLRGIGRIAFPLFAFGVVEGYIHTRNFSRYVIRIAVFAVISEVPFDMMKSMAWVATASNNVLWTFLVLLLVLRLCDLVRDRVTLRLQNPILGIALTAAAVAGGALLATFLYTDYSWGGILLGVSFYLFRDRRWLMYLCAALSIVLFSVGNWIKLAALASFGLILLYDGRKSLIDNELPKYFFYVLYPLHMLLLGLYGVILRTGM